VNYLEEVAARIRATVPKAVVPDEDSEALFLIYAVLAFAKGAETDRSDVHNAWSAWMTMRGEDHEALRPFRELPEDVRAEDDPFVMAIRKVADDLPGS
jgi:hypothetical protein